MDANEAKAEVNVIGNAHMNEDEDQSAMNEANSVLEKLDWGVDVEYMKVLSVNEFKKLCGGRDNLYQALHYKGKSIDLD